MVSIWWFMNVLLHCSMNVLSMKWCFMKHGHRTKFTTWILICDTFMTHDQQGMTMCNRKKTVNTSPCCGKNQKSETSLYYQSKAVYVVIKPAVHSSCFSEYKKNSAASLVWPDHEVPIEDVWVSHTILKDNLNHYGKYSVWLSRQWRPQGVDHGLPNTVAAPPVILLSLRYCGVLKKKYLVKPANPKHPLVLGMWA